MSTISVQELLRSSLEQGFTGSRGFTGSKGGIGLTGSQGDTGFTGSVGFTGSRGFTGSVGAANASGTTNRISKFTNTNTLGDSQIFDNGTNVGIGTTSPDDKLHVIGNILSSNTVTAVDFNSTSDEKFKYNIQPIENALEKTLQLNGVSFQWKDSDKPAIGLIAQEVEKIIPSAVQVSNNIKTVSYGNIVGLLIEAIKDQQKQIEELKTFINKN